MSTEPKRQKKWIKTLKILAAYLVAAWTFLQFVDWILNRYNISPHWVDVLLWLFIGIIPSLAIYLYHQERINKRILKLREKILFPLNIIILCIVVYFGFGNSDLGATTKEIKYTNESGQTESKTITKEEFRIGIPIFAFENLTNDDSQEWLRYGIGRLLYQDLTQNKSLSPDFADISNTTSKIKEASLFYDFYVDGTFNKIGDDYEIKTFIKKSTNGKTLKEQTFKGPNLLVLLDDISVFITNQSGFVESNTLKYLDFPINEFMSNSMEALKEFIHGNYDKATSIDNRFTLAYLEDAKRALRFNRGKLETQDIADKAFAHRNKLPLQRQLEVNIQRNLAYENYDLAEEQVKLQLEVDPNNDFYNQVLYAIYGETRQTNKYLETTERLFTNEPNPDNGINLAVASMVRGDDDRLIAEIKKYEIINPSLSIFKLQPLLFKGKFTEAKNLLKDIKTLHPGYENRWQVYDTAIAYLIKNKLNTELYKDFVGRYRYDYNEQTLDLWIENDRIIRYVKNQSMAPLLLAGPQSIVGGFINSRTWRYDLVYNSSGKVIAMKTAQHDYKNSVSTWYWKEDQSILDAHRAFDKGKLDEAEKLYEIAVKENPEHAYLKNIVKHLQYRKVITPDSLQLQNKHFEGSYGPRKFWVENGKFYYKRKEENVNLPKVELLPISENTYMNNTKLGTLMTFETTDEGRLASVPHSFNTETMTWNRLAEETNNYYVKDKD
ncbi:hypothetical protein [uncultured Psychroserpens sp.]|uniref:tetratricopeptide repeat protein n=1 Tax=uncultured Psychroserpens sp. TaxID=255436 RepID=UPI002622C1D7|nr:hypothetical protein [uncultured Psychroserpens sp.]